MISPEALSAFTNYDKKSLTAGIVVGQGLKGRARAPQRAAPAGFPPELWTDAEQRVAAIVAASSEEESGETAEASAEWEFDENSFRFGVAVGCSLEGWGLDALPAFPDGWAKIAHYIRLTEGYREVYFYVRHYDEGPGGTGGTAWIDWGDGSPTESYHFSNYTDDDCSRHHYQADGDYVIMIVANKSASPFGFSWRNDCRPLVSVFLEGNIEAVGHDAFSSQSNLTDITIPDGVSMIGAEAFRWCDSLTGVEIPDSAETIYNSAFSECGNLISVKLPLNLRLIGDFAFMSCRNLRDVAFPEVVDSLTLSPYCFYDCPSLQSVTLPEGTWRIGEYAFYACASLESASLPDSLQLIETWAFASCSSLTNVTIPANVSSIDAYAFGGCGLRSVTVKGADTLIARDAFQYCYQLTDIYYAGTPEQWRERGAKDFSSNVAIHCDSAGPEN